MQKYIGGFHGKPQLSTLGGVRWRSQKEKVSASVKDLGASLEQSLPEVAHELFGGSMPAGSTLAEVADYITRAAPSFSLRGRRWRPTACCANGIPPPMKRGWTAIFTRP